MMTPKRWLSTLIFTCLCFKKPFLINIFFVAGITDYIKGGYLMRRAWKLYDKCYYEISAVGGPFLLWAPELRGSGNGVDLPSDLDDVQEAHDEVCK